MFHPSLLCLTVILISQSALARPRPENIRETAQTKSDKSTAEREENAELVGGGIDLLISEIFHRIIQERLENLLEGVSQPIKQELLDSSEYKIERNSAFEEQDLSVEVSLPVSVTEIPTDIFTSLPGYWLVDKEGSPIDDPQRDSNTSEKDQSASFLTENYKISDLFNSSS